MVILQFFTRFQKPKTDNYIIFNLCVERLIVVRRSKNGQDENYFSRHFNNEKKRLVGIMRARVI